MSVYPSAERLGAPLQVAFDANLGAGEDDRRFIFGTRFDIGEVFARLRPFQGAAGILRLPLPGGMMPKNIVLLSDGTGNSSAKLLKTNVWRLYESLVLDTPRRQIACYDDGVGTSGFKPLRILGGALGIGLKRNVLRLYRFLCEHYEPGDRIYLFGFSRGAFTVRVLLGLICSQGIVQTPRPGLPRSPDVPQPCTDQVFGSELARRARWAYREFRKQFNQAGVLVTLARSVRDAAFRLTEWRQCRYSATDNHPPPPIEFVGVWDTVDAYGLPVDELTAGIDRWVWPLSMPDLTVPDQVRKACHAVAIDDERNTFHPVLWDESKEAAPGAASIRDERVSQVWFAGMHSNVGGGYADDSLAFVSFEWMVAQAQALSAPLHFAPAVLNVHLARKDTLGRVYDSRRGVKGYYRYNPRRIEWLTNGLEHETRLFRENRVAAAIAAIWNRAGAWLNARLRRQPRVEPTVTVPLPKIHHSVFERIAAAPEAYAPIVLPEHYRVVCANGAIVAANEYESPPARASRVRRQEAVWDRVWYRRVVYFTAVGFTLGLLLMPFLDGTAGEVTSGPDGLPGRAIHALGEMLPAIASPFVEYYEARPAQLWPIAVIVMASVLGGWIQARIRDRMREAWLRTVPPPGTRLHELAKPAAWLHGLRSSALYQALFATLRRRVLPTVFGVASLLCIAGAINRVPFETANLFGAICSAPEHPSPELAIAAPLTTTITADDACNAAAARLKKGAEYRIEASKGQKWHDRTIPAPFPRGFRTWSRGLTSGQRILLLLATPFRRSWTDPWFALTARIGARGADYYPLDATTTTMTAQTDGELYLFVNDAILPVGPTGVGWSNAFYGNNKGDATITITRLR